MKLHDKTIGHIARLVQMAILTGTDVVDHLRMLTLKEGEDSFLHVDKDYQEVFDDQVGKMLKNAESVSKEEQEKLEE